MFAASFQIDWSPWGPAWFVVLAFALVSGLLWWLYRVDARRLPPARRRLLAAWRVASVCVVLLLLKEPSYRLVTTEERPPVAALVLDESLSMSLPDASDNPFINFYGEKDRAKKSRYAAAKRVAAALIPDLTRTHRVKLFVASDQLRPLADFPKGEKATPAGIAEALAKVPTPTGNCSSLGECVEDALRSLANAKLSAMLLLTDGRVAGGGTKLADAGVEASARRVPIHTIGFGTVEPLPDLKLMDLVAPPEANPEDIMNVQVTVGNTLRANLAVDLKLFQEGLAEPVATRKLVLPLGEAKVGVAAVPKQEGEITYRLEVPTFPEELDTENNAVTFHVGVARRRLRVLLVAGAPTAEFHHLVPALARDKVIKVNCFLQSADVNAVQQGNEAPIDDLPQTPAQWNRYDVVILMDIDPNKLTNEQENGLEELVHEHGGGVMFVAGRVHGMASLLQVRSAKMEAMLPVEINKNQYPEFERYFAEPFQCVRTREGEKHPLMIFAPTKEKNDEVWRSFGDLEFFWAHPVMGVKRQAIPLLAKRRAPGAGDGSGGGPSARDGVMALMRYGKGSTAYLGLNVLWKWRYPMESFDYDQFWTQTVRYLAEYRMLGAQRQVLLSTDKRVYAPGEAVNIQLSVLDPALASQLRAEQVFATVTDAHKGEYRVMLKASGQDISMHRGTFPAARLGEHEVRVSHVLAEDLAARKALFDEKVHFGVRMQSVEFRDTTADLPGLAALAEHTGGRSLDHSTMGEGVKKLPALLDPTPQSVPHESFADLWDQWYILLLLISLATVELWFRRNWGLL
ncbi:MAG: VWA domain-containing protein [Planctomycetes bacterium]|nr:VWA domain-containing protein [Planctomycetota bacterium]